MKSTNLLLWSKTDICSLIDCELRVLPALLSEETKKEISLIDTMTPKQKKKRYTLNHVHLILKDVYPFLSEEERRKMILPRHLLSMITSVKTA